MDLENRCFELKIVISNPPHQGEGKRFPAPGGREGELIPKLFISEKAATIQLGGEDLGI